MPPYVFSCCYVLFAVVKSGKNGQKAGSKDDSLERSAANDENYALAAKRDYDGLLDYG